MDHNNHKNGQHQYNELKFELILANVNVYYYINLFCQFSMYILPVES